MPLEEIWERTLQELENEVTRPAYEMFIRRLEPVSYEEDVLRMKIRGSFSSEYMMDYKKPIEDKLSTIANKHIAISVFQEENFQEETVAPKSYVMPEAKEETKQEPVMEQAAPLSEKPIKTSNTTLNDMYTFETFVVGESNQFCYNTSRAVAEKLGAIANPLFIYGDVGLGKTHLLHAIGNYVLATRPDLTVVHRHAAAFVTEMMNHIRNGQLVDFRNHYLRADLFLIDDIHNLKGKEGTQNEFFQIFNAFYENKKQIVVTCDRPPKELKELEERVVSRLGWGVIADIQMPNYETRLAILKRKLAADSFSDESDFPDNVLEYIASRINTNIRDLEGALMSIRARAKYNHQHVSIELAEDIINNIAPPKDPKKINPALIIKTVSDHYEIPEEELLGKRRKKEIVLPRMVSMFLIREITKLPFISIGDVFKKDHSSVLYAYEKIDKDMKQDTHLKRTISDLKDKIVS